MKRTHCIVGLLLGLVVACQASAPEQSAPALPISGKVYADNYDVRDLVVYDPTVHHLRLVDEGGEAPPTNRPLQVPRELLEAHAIEMAQALPSWNEECAIGCDDLYLIVIGTDEIHSHVAAFLAGARAIDDWSATRKDAPGRAR
jgi:hypothetical protein